MTRWHAPLAWLGDRVAHDVLIESAGERLAAVTPGAAPPQDAERLRGMVLPGLANTHSHAFHRALRGRAQREAGTFWSWRAEMYAIATRLTPDTYLALARATFAEMALAGVTAVGEFHYLHHAPDGGPYDDPNAMSHALAAAAGEAGIRMTLLDTCYLHGGFGQPLEGPQLRFGDGDAERWAKRAAAMTAGPAVQVGAAIHSVRALEPDEMAIVAAWAGSRQSPLHVHLSEQPAENKAALSATGRTPTRLLAEAGALGQRCTAVHATHLTDDDIALLGGSRTGVCLCPTTERDLADGIGPALALNDAGATLSVGSDSHAVIDLFEEARAIELNQRMCSGQRGGFTPESLLTAMTAGGMTALGWDAGTLTVGRLADFTCIDLDTPRMAGATSGDLLGHVAFAATSGDVSDVVVGGVPVVRDRRHTRVEDVGRALRQAIDAAVTA